MIIVSEQAAAVINSTFRTFQTRFLRDGKTISGDIRSVTIHKGSCGESQFTPGSIYGSYIEAVIDNCTEPLEGKELQYQIGVVIDGETEWYDIGWYTVSKPATNVHSTSFTALGRLSAKLGGVYVSELNYPATVQAVLDEIEANTGVRIDASGFDTSNKIETKPSGYMYREMLAIIAGVFFGYATDDSSGDIVFGKFNITENIIETDGDRTTELPTFTDIDTEITGIKVSVSSESSDGTESGKTFVSGIVNVAVSNPFMTQELFDAGIGNLIGFKYSPGTVSISLGDFRIEPFDCLKVTDTSGTVRYVPCMSITHTFDGGITTEVIAPGLENEEGDTAAFRGSLGQVIERFETELVTAKKVIAEKVSADYVEANYATLKCAEILEANINTLSGDLASYKTVVANDFTAVNGQITTLSGELSIYKTQIAEDFTAVNAHIADLQAKDAEIETALIGKASVIDLEAVSTRTGALEAGVADINTLLSGNLTSANIQSLTLNSTNTTVENGFIKNAMIESLAFDKLTGIDINTTLLTVHSDDGLSTWADNTIQISDADRVRVQIGKDASGDYTLAVWDAAGQLIWDALGATEHTIQRKIIRDAVVADDAAIAGSKLDIESVVREVNGATTKLSSTTILLDDKNQTLDVVFDTLESTVITNLADAKSYADAQASGALTDARAYADSTAGTALSTAQQYALNQADAALASAKSYTDTGIAGIEIGGRNLVLDSDTEKHTKNSYLVYTLSEYGISAVRGDTVTISFDAYSDTAGIPIDTYIRYVDASGAGHVAGTSIKIAGITTSYKRYAGVFNVSDVDDIIHVAVRSSSSGVSGGSSTATLYVKNIKVELGNKATDWTPAPEDVDAAISAVDAKFASYSTTTQMAAAITAAKDSITASVSETYATKTALSTANSNITALSTRVSSAESKLTKDSLVTTIGSYYTTQTDVTGAIDSIEVGGRNLIRNTGTGEGWNYTSFDASAREFARSTTATTECFIISPKESAMFNLEAGQQYTLSFEAKQNGYVKSRDVFFLTSTFATTGIPYVKYGISVSTDYQKYQITFTPSASATNLDDVYIRFDNNGSTTSGTAAILYVKDVKLEKGNKATDWTPAPEDIEASISSVETVATQTADKFNWLVKSGTSATDFTLTDRTATLIAQTISLNGDVQVSGSMLVDGAVTAAKIASGAITADKISVTDLSAIGATIGGWTVSSTRIYGGTSSTGVAVMQMPSSSITWVFAAGGTSHDSYADCPFRVSKAGKLYATDATLSGSVTATAGVISGWTVTGSRLEKDSTASGGYRVGIQALDSGAAFYAGCSTAAGGSIVGYSKFYVTQAGHLYSDDADISGKVTATSGTIGGWELTATKIYGGTSSTGVAVMQMPSSSITWVFAAGGTSHDSYADCPFRVSKAGKLYATSGTIGGWSINSDSLSKSWPASTYAKCDAKIGTHTDSNIVSVTSNDIESFYVTRTGITYARTFRYLTSAASSSMRYKTNIAPMDGAAADRLMDVSIYSFDYRPGYGDKGMYGVLAEELASIHPAAVVYDGYGRPDGVDYTRLVPLIVKKLQMQQAEISALRQQLASAI